MKGVPQEAIEQVKREFGETGEELYERMVTEEVEYLLALPSMPRFCYDRETRTCEIRLQDDEVRKVGGSYGPRVKRIKLDS
jgi:hypothetical protein